MKRISQLANPRMAQAFIDYMATRGIRLHLEQQQQYYLLWLDDDEQLALVESEYALFIRDPDHPRYQDASWKSGDTRFQINYPRGHLWRTVRERGGPITMTVSALCILVFILMQLLGEDRVLSWLAWPQGPDQYFQVWRWVSPAFLHFSFLHILFNLLWWWYLGGAVEKRLGSGKLFVITLISALLSGWMQAKFSGVWFGGLSGVVYALMGYCWLRGELDPDSGVYLERGLIVFSILWLVVGYYGLFGMSIANMAHFTGLLTGLAMAFVDSRAAGKAGRK
ncbi:MULTISPECIES: rhomboid family intramembrane serine protease GlpG [unclassified Tatumella]|uniref:rhomboid family intramembrane serine protease GlpG n=1 Tax=unclassified Tatumella TaxID=2649542 RepID=UPI001BB07B01|nr:MULTISPECIES: rhomboid family intramembrane serine protease GlpG [unclassified Tatumella]MBS0855679.1 rhomboid family intramembrane serine protease GlpG [Tatumella sp. JGM16]MBS0876660.1 rhomboid family intramembrane serine protease GlpG [Tatumella sp. JGM82]MBS0889953.1 rhomboid family intramembrane serine protease GlpG [Tatumella sp. JGM94]MBS0901197.1 rhomboid family intramembrane serine protease GlpG [Tatumella sp. JGM100]MBS0912456.1 rhomboid family intramembrane serine protease GlpG [